MLEAFNQKKYFPNGESNLQPQRKNANDFPQHYRDLHSSALVAHLQLQGK